MESIIFDWLHFLVRWVHIITAIAWIGASFYFIWLDNNLENPPAWKKEKGIKGDLWAFHGGGIYEVGKYQLAPPQMPKTLHWFKWEAYSTWISGALLLVIFYYVQADLYLVGQQAWTNSATKAICTSVVFLASGLLVYEFLIRTLARRHFLVFVGLLLSVIVFYTLFAVYSFSGRAAYLHIGALLATIMAANVFLGIMPAQRSFITAIENQQKPDADRMDFAKARSVHNNYFTLPVLICMISNHYPFLYGNEYSTWIICVMMATSAYVRHFFNLRHKGIFRPQILIVGIAILISLAILMSWQEHKKSKESHVNYSPSSQLSITKNKDAENALDSSSSLPRTNDPEKTEDVQLMQLVAKHCQNCHSLTPSSKAFTAAPLGIALDKLSQVVEFKTKITTAVSTNYMPLGNLTQMTSVERSNFLTLLQHLESKKALDKSTQP